MFVILLGMNGVYLTGGLAIRVRLATQLNCLLDVY